MGHRFNPKHVEKLFSPERQKALPPGEVLSLLNLTRDMTVADVGCGPGYFTIPLAEMTDELVYALDVSEEMLAMLTERAEQAGVGNLKKVLSQAENLQLPDDSADAVVCSLVLHEVDDLNQTLLEFKRVLRPGGRMLLIEWEKRSMEMGPPVEIRIDSADLKRAVEAIGYECQISNPTPDLYIVLAQ